MKRREILYPDFFRSTPSPILHDIYYIKDFLKNNYAAKCYIVGGAVRDRLLGQESKDYDIECYGVTPESFEEAMEHLGAQGVGKSFFVYKYRRLDIALPRIEKKVGIGHRGFKVEPAYDERDASRRRDFTMNALMYDIDRRLIVDYWGGLEDLESKCLRVVDPVSFVEDSLRVLRAMQFAARFGLKIEKSSCELCRSIRLDDLPRERIFSEFEKMFRAPYLHYGLYYFFALGVAGQIYSVEIDRKNFTILAKRLASFRHSFTERLLPYYFSYIVAPFLGIERSVFLEKIGAPSLYYKKVADVPLLPEKIDCAFVARAAEKRGISEFVGNYQPRVRELAGRLDVWSKPFDTGVQPALLMKEGFRGRELGEELARLREERIGRLDEDCS